MTFCTINELNLAWFVVRSVFGRPVYVLAVEPLIPSLLALIQPVIAFLAARGRLKLATDVFAELDQYQDGEGEISFAHVYPRHEPAINDVFRIDRNALGMYDLIYRHAVSGRLKLHLERIVILRRMRPALAAKGVRLQGLPPEFFDTYGAIYGEKLGLGRPSGRVARCMVNVLLASVVIAAAIMTAVSRISLRKARRRAFALAADLAEEGRVRNFFKQISSSPDEILFVLRNPAVRGNLDDGELAKYYHADLNEGQLTIQEMSIILLTAFRDCIKILFRIPLAPTPTFLAVIKQIINRIRFRAFLNCYDLGTFMARDEYNSDHITRTQELRRRGVRSAGILHGMSTGPRVYPHIRYLDFDTLYLFGRHQHAAYIDTWPLGMSVRPVGCYSLTRAQMKCLGGPRSRDIVLFASQVSDNDAYIRLIADIARRFPDRKVYLKLKYMRDYIGAHIYDPYLEIFGRPPAHTELIETPPYELLMEVGYSFSAVSSVVAEALQMGAVSYFVDTYDDSQDVVFRDFPDLCVRSSEQAINAILAIENGNATYPRDHFGDLIDLSGANIFDVIRDDFGLPPWTGTIDGEAA